jgi:L-fuconolactonase
MPETPIIDSHVHLWDPRRFRMSWLDGDDLLDRPYGLDEYRQHTAGLDIAGMIYVQVEVEPAYALLEAEWVVARSGEEPRLRGIVPWAPLEYGERARAFVEALVAIDHRIKGVRRLLQSEPDPAFCTRPDFVRGVQILAEYGLSFDICIRQHQLPSVVAMVGQCPQTNFVLDHIGKANIKDRELDPWREGIRQLAGFPNVLCKISGMATEADWSTWTPEDLRPYFAHVVEQFGEDRVMFGGDWPVALHATSYRRWVDTVDALAAGLSADTRRKLWSDNARRFYRLDQP